MWNYYFRIFYGFVCIVFGYIFYKIYIFCYHSGSRCEITIGAGDGQTSPRPPAYETVVHAAPNRYPVYISHYPQTPPTNISIHSAGTLPTTVARQQSPPKYNECVLTIEDLES